MTYTAEQLRAKARNLRANGHPMGAHECEAHADALEENARLKSKLIDYAADISNYQDRELSFDAWKQRAERAEAELAKLRAHAEAMATHWEKDDTMDLMASAVTAYRRDYPEGTK